MDDSKTAQPDPVLPRQNPKTHPAFKFFLNIIIIFTLFTNAAIILGFTNFPVALPANKFAKHMFNVYTLFSGYSAWNRDFSIEVLVQDQRSSRPNDWILLDTYDYFPFKKGAQSSRFLALMHSVKLERSQYHSALRFLAQKIKERYDRLHPDEKAIGIKLVMEVWPTSKESYYDQKIPRLTKYMIIYED